MQAGDEQLMLAYREGDAGAFEEIYRRHKGGLFRFVLRSVRERAVAEELYQEIWMRVIEARGRYEVSAPGAGQPAKFSTWLYTIAHNRLVDHWRKRGLQLVALDAQDPAADPSAPMEYEPQRIAEAKQGLELFARALAELPPAQREAFLMHQEADMSAAEIALATGSNEEAAKSRLRYAVSKLKQAMGGG
ncbi:MAG TPA: sigma-70 family RNA polymerase sigma factor [Burkholderiales bacterium]|nr:sigma-70 family RNA polymerase sigma factor [Burkholderiales bacterium]